MTEQSLYLNLQRQRERTLEAGIVVTGHRAGHLLPHERFEVTSSVMTAYFDVAAGCC
jgi:hypothetical protein